MRLRLAAAAAVCLALAGRMSAHRLDEYLQAALVTVEKNRIQVSMRLIPGVAVYSAVLASIDSNGDGVVSGSEGRAYAGRLLRDLSLTVDGNHLTPQLISFEFPKVEDMKEGLGEIHIDFSADLPQDGPNRKLVFENHHQSRISVYLMNCLVPRDRNIRIVAQNRNENQSFYELDYLQGDGHPDPLAMRLWSAARASFGNAGGFPSMFRLGIRHIAEGADHLLFLLALLLPAPLIVFGSRWAGSAGVRQCLLRILQIVTAFTLGHSITLALAAFGFVQVPGRPIEVLIAVSILVSAIHAFRPLFPGREAVIAAFFGLIHGLAFATTLGHLGLGRWERFASILGFNLGIETMQLIVVAATMPSLILLSRTGAYAALRIGGAFFAGIASLGWIAERLFNVPTPVDVIVNSVARHSVWIAACLFLVSVACWLSRDHLASPRAPSQRVSEAKQLKESLRYN